MLKNQEFKAYGSIRKMKSGGACGVILALAMLGLAFSSTVTADEVNANTPVAIEKKAEFEVTISHESLDKAMTEAKEAGVNVEIDDVQDKGVATSETVVSEQKEIEADYAKQEAEVKQKTDEYKKAKTNNEAERQAVLAENERIEHDNAKKKDDYKESLKAQEDYNKKVDKENTELKEQYDKKLENYNKELAAYNNQKEELAKKGLKAENTHIKVYGNYDESKRGSVGYYRSLTVSFEGVEGLTAVKDYIGLHSDTTISGSRTDLLSKNDDVFAEIVNPKAGDSFTLHNVAESKEGQKISARFTFNSAEAEWVKDGKPLSATKIFIRKDNGSGSINFLFGNLVQFDTKIDFFDEKTGKEVGMAIAATFNDIDYGQELRFTYQDGSEGIVLNPNGSEVKKVNRDNKEYYKGEYKTPWTHDVPELGVKAGDLGYANVGDESDIPLGSLLSVGYGSKLNFAYHNGVGVHGEEEIESKRAEVKRQLGSAGSNLKDEDIFYQDGWAVGIFGKASSTVPVTILSKPPVEPEWKKKDTKEIKLVLRKPKDLPNKPDAPTVKIKYRRLRVNPSTPKPVKAITDNFGNNIDSANTFDKNVKFSLTTDYKPYSTFTADSKTHGKTWAMVDDVQDGAYTVDDNKITMKDSTGKDVKDLFNMYHVLSEKERTHEIQNILKEAGLNPKGEFYMFVAKDSASFYKNYVRQAKNITIDLPAHLLVEKGQIVKNDFHQIDFGNGFVSNLVTVQVPNLKPEKHALDHKDNSKVRDGQEIQIGEYLRYLLDGVTVPAKHDTLYQYDGIDKLDVRHDRYTGNWSGIIRGSEYLAEKDLVLPYDVVLADGKVVKAGDQIVKGSAYAFKFEFDQSTNSDFIKKIVKVTWNEQDGKWAYTIDKEFLNSLGVQGTFDADFYIEVERIASGKVENKFVNIINGQEMEAKVVTHTPEVPNSPELPKLPNPVKPTEPSKTVEPSQSVESVKQEQSVELTELPNTGTDASSLGLIGTAILSVLGLAGFKRKKY
ncbi:cell surface protein [Streptococcus pneumoniae]|nr:cell surface protein [Streptococcus pneumoniae]VNN46792.1 cell surface protein [Streptococcus pneumoniae]VOP90558.1 cell surface protein [Streptococcus pneumoniae]VRN76789.1 cell surface protein [Streptococcus pneumoniae]VSQ74455.1 cell surface protein [Streptococcus pneumoniae]